MTISTTKKLAGITAAAGLIIALAGCGSAPETTTPSASGDTSNVIEGFKPCMVSDQGGFDDKSFNQLGYEGLVRAAATLGLDDPITVQSDSESDFAPNLTNLVDQNCTLIITVGFALASATVESALANPDIEYVMIDDSADTDFDGETDAPNIKPILFDTAQAAFLAGYASASYSTAKKVGTFGGQNFPTVSIFMDGFAQGVDYWNTEKSDDVQVIGWDRAAQDGVFTGAFTANQDAINAAQGLVDQGVDVLLPVGGPIYQSAASVIRDSGREIALIGVDADVYETDPSVADLLLTSIRKLIDVGVEDAVTAAATGDFDATPFVGTLENDGVGLAPFHDFESKVSSDLQGELDDITAKIISGDITVESYLAG
ncbi:MAG: BMP family ABC transporter substrate-binding protein [Microbacterium sp. SCN 70-200]|uniref:BMP family lipoprotein n=1 Tax=unclassified Microbacterium TaxID=2609290 RepID=UPI00086DA352|nr:MULTISPECIES: BMP family ABC transporter substrate-binding protein [unclassified Microbacterium]MBN9213804.1 BMP family ABC transporter substrate-binding protein [Microbacterium sp.]ODT42363.1 MAG: BMP family ABC transporter substrate-binding protein [Microbacterium sp. SCN 70-200]OJV85509.1 MAG: BMP family ABC transporter substrate-binding protein [Microbacterium sp. 70-16]